MFIINLEICYNMNTDIIERGYFGGYMENLLTTIERENHIREIFLSMFKEEGISQQELEKAICESYCEEGFQCESIKDIPINVDANPADSQHSIIASFISFKRYSYK